MKKFRENKITWILLIIVILFLGGSFFSKVWHTVDSKEEEYVICEILEKDEEGNLLVELPRDKTKWIQIKDEKVSEDCVELLIYTYYNCFGAVINQSLIDTAMINNE